MGKRKDYEIRKELLWGSMMNQPLGQLFDDLLRCRYHPEPLSAFDAKEREVLLLLADARAHINSFTRMENK